MVFITFFMLFCSRPLRQITPNNYILLFMMTAGFSSSSAAFAAELTPGSVLTAMGSVATITGLLYIAAVRVRKSPELIMSFFCFAMIGLVVQTILFINKVRLRAEQQQRLELAVGHVEMHIHMINAKQRGIWSPVNQIKLHVNLRSASAMAM